MIGQRPFAALQQPLAQTGAVAGCIMGCPVEIFRLAMGDAHVLIIEQSHNGCFPKTVFVALVTIFGHTCPRPIAAIAYKHCLSRPSRKSPPRWMMCLLMVNKSRARVGAVGNLPLAGAGLVALALAPAGPKGWKLPMRSGPN
jgi:hypothetical protein